MKSQYLRIQDLPKLSGARLVMGFTGWMDGGDVSTGTIDYLVDALGADRIADIDPAPYLTRVGLSPDTYGNRLVDTSLSGGERKRIELAAVLAMKPQFAILDEPTAGIDMLSVHDMMNVIHSFKEEGASVLLITHQETIALMADQASQLCGGRIISSGSPKDVADQYKKGSCIRCDGATCLPLLKAQ